MFPKGGHNIFKIVKEKNGLTLIELLLALAILGIVIAVAYSFYFYAEKSFTNANKQTELQFNVRMASERIDGIVRYVSGVEILENYSGGATAEAIYEEAGSLMHYKNGITTNLLGNSYGDITFDLTYNKTDEDLLWYKIRGKMKGNQIYEISKEIQLLNVNPNKGGEIIKKFGDSSTLGKAIILKQEDSES